MYSGIIRQDIEHFSAAAQNKKIVLWGFYETAVLKALSQYTDIECIIDGDSETWGLSCGGVRIFPAEHLYALSPETHVVLYTGRPGGAYSATRAILAVDDFDIFYYNVISDKFFCFFSGELFDHLDRIRNVENMLSDDRSRKIYREVVYRRLMGATGEFNSLKTRDNPQYIFLPMFRDLSDEVIIDCGGYIGDSVEKFVAAFGNHVRKVYSFECLKENIQKIRETGSRLKADGWDGELVIAPYAVSDRDGTVTFNDIGKPKGGYLPENRQTLEYNDKLAPIETFEVEARAIDSFVPAEERITYIKMDIEGAEYAALVGAEKTIKTHRPRLAISIYHNPADYWRLCELIHKFCPEYKFAVRHHQNNHLDTVLYAWVEE